MAPDCGRKRLKAGVGCTRTRHFISQGGSITCRNNSGIEIFSGVWKKKKERQKGGKRGRERKMRLRNIKKQPESVWKPWIFYSPLVNNFGPTPPSHCSKGHWESDTVYLQSHLTQPINHQPQAFSHRPRWGGLCAISWKRLTPSAMADLSFFFNLSEGVSFLRLKKKKMAPSHDIKKIVYSDMIWQCLVVSF